MYRLTLFVCAALLSAGCQTLHRPDADEFKIDEVLGVRGEQPLPSALDGMPVIHSTGQPQASRYEPMNKKFTFSGTAPKREKSNKPRR